MSEDCIMRATLPHPTPMILTAPSLYLTLWEQNRSSTGAPKSSRVALWKCSEQLRTARKSKGRRWCKVESLRRGLLRDGLEGMVLVYLSQGMGPARPSISEQFRAAPSGSGQIAEAGDGTPAAVNHIDLLTAARCRAICSP